MKALRRRCNASAPSNGKICRGEGLVCVCVCVWPEGPVGDAHGTLQAAVQRQPEHENAVRLPCSVANKSSAFQNSSMNPYSIPVSTITDVFMFVSY